jgi:DNA-binding beta-propeller fold protein YncE
LLSLDRLEPIGDVRLPTAELEDIEFDPESRQIYHVDRATGNVLAVDADTFRVRRVATIHEPTSAGSTKVALDKSSNHIVVSWEDNNLFSVDLATSQWTLLGRPDNVNLLADRRNELVYIDETWEPWITAMDLKNKTPPRRVRGPVVSERLVLSEKRRELYVPDPRGGKIWVYSTPDLRLVRKIRSEYTVRAVAVDDDHGLLLAASVVTGRVQVIDVETAELLQEHYVGKRCRIMQLDTPTRRAFVTLTRDGLVVLHY